MQYANLNEKKEIEYYKSVAQKAGELRLRETEELWRMIVLRQQAEAELKRARDELERRVEERTADLVEANELLRIEVAEREQIMAQLSESEEKYRAMFEDSLEAMCLAQEGVIADVNPSWLRLFGYESKDEVLSKSLINMVAVEDQKQIEMRDGFWPDTQAQVSSLRGRRKDGSLLDIEVYSNHIVIGGKVSFLTTIHDVSQQKQVEQEKERLEERLRQSEKMEAIGTLAGGVAHDLNNILGGIIIYPELLLMDLPEESPLRETVLDIKNAGQKAAAIVRDLLALARRGVATTRVVNFNRLIRDFLKSPEYKRLVTFHDQVTVETHLAPALLGMTGSPVHLSQTIMNLVSNAAEAMPHGGIISITTDNCHIDDTTEGGLPLEVGDYITLKISDTGMGISKQDLTRIFEPFYTKKVMGRSGTGLGMTVVWGTVQDHNGHIEVDSVVNRGTHVTLWFRATRNEVLEEATADSIDEWLGTGETILIVDDVEEQRTIATKLLKRLGYAVSTVSSGEEAVEYIAHHEVDLLILDMVMSPGIDGHETYKRILDIRPNQKAILVSGFSESERVRMTQDLGAKAYIQKPYASAILAEAIHKELKTGGTVIKL